MKSENSSVLASLMILIVYLVAVIGWVINVVSLVSANSMGGLEVARAIGILVAPLGAVLGWFA